MRVYTGVDVRGYPMVTLTGRGADDEESLAAVGEVVFEVENGEEGMLWRTGWSSFSSHRMMAASFGCMVGDACVWSHVWT